MQKNAIKELILTLAGSIDELRLKDVTEALGLSKDDAATRRAIQRSFAELIDEGKIRAVGMARARTYAIVNEVKTEVITGISLTTDSKQLLKYVSAPLSARKPVSYQQDFLRKYIPNKMFFLTGEERMKLLEIGKVEHKSRPAGTYARDILNRLLVDLSWNSSRLEGNTYSLLETKRLIELGQSTEGKDLAEGQMILNHKGAIEYIIELAGEKDISAHQVRSVHGLLSENLLGDPSASGRLRQISVGIADTTYLPLDNPHTLQECFDLFIKKLNMITDPFEQSLFSLVQLSYMQAFEDVNKRTARIVANIPLIRTNLRPLSFMDVEQDVYVKALLGVYEKTDISLIRDLYLWAYQRSCEKYSAIQQNLGEPNILKLKYRTSIQEIIRKLILQKTPAKSLVSKIKKMIKELEIPEVDALELFKLIEIDIASLHDGNIARLKIKPSEFVSWKALQ
jgi:Fic family protein